MRYTFKVNERLKKEQHIDTLFQAGKAFSVFPIRFVFLNVVRPAATDSPVMAGFSVPKKKFRKSVDRHRIRRLMVESWRLQKHLLYDRLTSDQQLHIFLIYTDGSIPEYQTVFDAVGQAVKKLAAICGATGQ